MHTARKAKREARDLARFARAGPNGAEAGSWARAIQIWGKDENPIEWREDSDDDNDWFPEGDDDVSSSFDKACNANGEELASWVVRLVWWYPEEY